MKNRRNPIINWQSGTVMLLLAVIVFLAGCALLQTRNQDITQFPHSQWTRNQTIYEVNIRQYTPEGTFRAFERHIPRLRELGIGIIWLMPVHPIGLENRKGSLGSYYSVQDYLKVNPEYGTMEDFRHLVQTIHDHGMYVILDWVANHTAWDHPWVTEHPEWYTRNKEGAMIPPVADWFDVVDLDYNQQELWEAMTSALEFWVRDLDIDGYRCDVADLVPIEFWNQARTRLEVIKPVFMLAESSSPYQHQAFDMTYSWKASEMINRIAAGDANARSFQRAWDKEKKLYPQDAYRMLFTSNHDENSWNGTVGERLGPAAEIGAVLTMTLPGMPLVYSGQEAGLDHRLDFFEKDTINWQPYHLESVYQTLLNLKLNEPIFMNGEMGGSHHWLKTSRPKDITAFIRIYQDDIVLVWANMSPNEQVWQLESDLPPNIHFKDVFTGRTVQMVRDLPRKSPPWSYQVLVNH